MNTIGHWLAQAIDQLRRSAHTDTPELDAQLLACHFLKTTRSRLYAFPETPISEAVNDVLDAALNRRIHAEPIAYITGNREFWSTGLRTAPGTLIPRADTEVLVDKALQLVANAPEGIVMDLGTGTGAIAIAVASELPDREVVAIERSQLALPIAHENTQAKACHNLHLIQGCWLDAIADNTLAMILANPPYLASNDPHLEQLRFEPREALVSGLTGLEDLEHIIAETRRAGKNGAPLIVEHGSHQGADVRQLLRTFRYTDIGTGVDLAGLERISFGYVNRASS